MKKIEIRKAGPVRLTSLNESGSSRLVTVCAGACF
jgi:hypothetical protein